MKFTTAPNLGRPGFLVLFGLSTAAGVLAVSAADPAHGWLSWRGPQRFLVGFSADGEPRWSHSLMEEFGRFTFPNSRTASPLIDHGVVIPRGITANWGAQGPAADRFYAFDKQTGELVWVSSPGDR